MRPLAQSDGHDAPWLIDELVPRLTAMVDEIVVGFEDAIGEPLMFVVNDFERAYTMPSDWGEVR